MIKKSIETDLEIEQIIELTDKDIKTVLMTVFFIFQKIR